MQPVDATSATHSVSAMRNMVTDKKNTNTTVKVLPIPIVEPVPHYPLSASVKEMLAYIGELIESQNETAREAMRQDNLSKTQAEISRLFDTENANLVKETENQPANDAIIAAKTTYDAENTKDTNASKISM